MAVNGHALLNKTGAAVLAALTLAGGLVLATVGVVGYIDEAAEKAAQTVVAPLAGDVQRIREDVKWLVDRERKRAP